MGLISTVRDPIERWLVTNAHISRWQVSVNFKRYPILTRCSSFREKVKFAGWRARNANLYLARCKKQNPKSVVVNAKVNIYFWGYGHYISKRTTLLTSKQPCTNVHTTSCAYWDVSLMDTIDFHKILKRNAYWRNNFIIGCSFKGGRYADKESWKDDKDACKTYECHVS